MPVVSSSADRFLTAPNILTYEMRRLAPAARRLIVSDNYIIEIRPEFSGRTVQAGIVVREGGSYRFFAANDAFFSLEQRLFKNPQVAAAAALQHVKNSRPRQPQFQPFVPDAVARYADSGDFGLSGG